jgi:hypothetical protein
MIKLPEDFPGVRSESVRLVKEQYDAFSVISGLEPIAFDPKKHWLSIEAQATLLRDLSRPTSRDWLLRQMAYTIWGTVPESCPGWSKNRKGGFILSRRGDYRTFCSNVESSRDFPVPGIERLNPTEALHKAALAVAAAVNMSLPEGGQP